ncbi:MAG: biotin--[acetyl-CoA-carboxylase] ligase [Ignavibacteriae bacterium]|nr:biotin--[acetyl-CoA-carboxylase] ligase [Ignavibacteriota bacterium]
MNIKTVKEGLLQTGLKNVVYFPQLHSTNKYAKENNLQSDNLVITSNQYEGRGRFDRIWESIENNNLTFTIVKNFQIEKKDLFVVNFYVSYIVMKAIKEIFPDYMHRYFSLKWPNDMMIKGKKFAGILSEVQNINSAEKKFIIGVGINVNQKEFSDAIIHKATSLRLETGIIFELEDLLCRIVKEFYSNFNILSRKKELLDIWKSNSFLMDKEVRFRKTLDNTEISGKVLDITEDGGIKIESVEEFNTKKITVYYTGEISFIY